MTIKQLRSMTRSGSPEWTPALGVWSTGLLSLDMILGKDKDLNYGMPRGTIVEVFGHSDSGKSALVVQWAKSIIDQNGSVAYFNSDGRLSLQFICDVGIDPDLPTKTFGVYDNYIISEVFQIIEAEIDRRDLIIVDSVAALATESEASSQLAELPPMDEFLHQVDRSLLMLRHKLLNRRATIVLVNQIRQDIENGFGYHAAFPTAVKPNAQIRIDVQKINSINRDGDLQYLGYGMIGHTLSVEVVKNEPFRPHGKSVLDLYYSQGFDTITDILNMAVNLDMIEKYPNGKYLVVGTKDVVDTKTIRNYVIENRDDLRKKIIEEYTIRDKWYPQNGGNNGRSQ